MKPNLGMGATAKSKKPSKQLIVCGIERDRQSLSLAGGVDRVNPRVGRGKFIVVGVRGWSYYLFRTNLKILITSPDP